MNNKNQSNTPQDPNVSCSFTIGHEQNISELIQAVVKLEKELNDIKTNNQYDIVEYDFKNPEEFTGKQHKLANFLSIRCLIIP